MNGSKELKWFHSSSCFCCLWWIFTVILKFPGKVFPMNKTGLTHPLSPVAEEVFAQAEPLSCSGHEPASPWRLRLDKAVDSARSSGCLLVQILALQQSQGDSRWLRIPLESNLSKAVQEGQHGWSHGGPAWRKKGIKFRFSCRITKPQNSDSLDFLLYCVIVQCLLISVINRGQTGR